MLPFEKIYLFIKIVPEKFLSTHLKLRPQARVARKRFEDAEKLCYHVNVFPPSGSGQFSQKTGTEKHL